MRCKPSSPEKEMGVARETAQPQTVAHSTAKSRQAASLLGYQSTYGNRFVQRLLRSAMVQAKLKISQPDDAHEREADQVADQVMRMSDVAVSEAAGVLGRSPVPEIQRVCSGCEEELHRQEEEEQQQEGNSSEGSVDMDMPLPDELESRPPLISGPKPEAHLQRACGTCVGREIERQLLANEPPELKAAASFEPIRTGGEPLDNQTRAFFEPRFGRAFDQVRIHKGADAAVSAGAVSALAYTVGHNIVFGAEQYKPDTSEGRRLLAHELTHVVQQNAAHALPKPSASPNSLIEIHSGPGGDILHRWHVGGTAPTNTNTIVCDGSGGVTTQLGATGNADQTRVLSACIRRHEESHRSDALGSNANICRDKAVNSQLLFDAGEQNPSEFRAYDAEITCLNAQLATAPDADKPIIQARITQITPIRDGFR